MNIIILTGGTSKRFGSDKFQAIVGGKTLLEILVSHLPPNNLIVVGPPTNISAKYVQEQPIFSGPVAAIAAGMTFVKHDLVAIYATDMPFAPILLNELISSLLADGIVPLDENGIAQPLAGLYRTSALKTALATYSKIENNSVKSLMAKLNIDYHSTSHPEYLLDIDTVSDLERANTIQSRVTQ